MDILHQDLPSKRNGSFMESSMDDEFDEAFYESILSELSDSDKTNDDDELPADREPDDSNNVKSESEDFKCGDYSSSMFDEGDEDDFFDDDDDDDDDIYICVCICESNGAIDQSSKFHTIIKRCEEERVHVVH